MSIVFGGDVGINTNGFSNFTSGLLNQFQQFSNSATSNVWNALSQLGQSAAPVTQTQYVDDGFESVPGLNYAKSQGVGTAQNASASNNSYVQTIKTRRITTQEPNYTIYVKKRAFSSLKALNDTRFLDSGEKLVLSATKILFENKCAQIAAYESISKANKLVSEEADLDAFRIGLLANLINGALTNGQNVFTQAYSSTTDPAQFAALNQEYSQFQSQISQYQKLTSVLDKLTALVQQEKQATITNWVIDPNNDNSLYNIGRGSGVIELTMTNSLNTLNSIDGGQGSVSFNLQDPLRLAIINANDIEIALAAAFNNSLSNQGAQQPSNGLDISAQEILNQAQQLDQILNQSRAQRIGNASLTDVALGQVTFTIQPAANVSQQVTGTIAGVNIVFTPSNYNIALAAVDPLLQFTLSEGQMFVTICNLLFQYLTKLQDQSNQVINNNSNPDITYARRSLRMQYLGRHIVQPMDEVSIFIRSKTIEDGQTSPGSILNNTPFVQNFLKDYAASDAELHYEIKQFNLEQFGIDINIYRILRTESFLRNSGTCVFSGLLSTVVENYDTDSGYVLQVSGANNLKWLSMSRVPDSPSADQTQTFLEDPFSAYTFSPDPATGLVLNQPKLIQSNVDRIANSNLVFNDGPRKGQFIANDQGRLVQDNITFGSQTYNVIQHLPGFVYKWKQGVIAATLNVAPGKNSDQKFIGLSLTESPFTNLDIADIISILVIGFPHNYEAFVLNSTAVGNYVFNGAGDNNPISYFNSFFDIYRRQNRTAGSFQPYKPLTVDQNQMASRINLQVHLTQQSDQLSTQQSALATLQDQLNQSLINTGNATPSATQQATMTQITELQNSIQATLNNIQSTIKGASAIGYKTYGSTIVSQLNNSTSGSQAQSTSDSNTQQKLLSQFQTFRTQLDAKFNRDTNYFIVDDHYDKDLDIQAFMLNLGGGVNLFNSTYQDALGICESSAKMINFEFFANTQGHIEFRAPQYNKTPLSILLRMMQQAQTQNINVFPPFLNSLFSNQQTYLSNQLSIVNNSIDDARILLGITTPPTPQVSSITYTANYLVQNPVLSSSSAPNTDDAGLLLEVRTQQQTLTGDTSLLPLLPNQDAQLAALEQEILMYQSSTNPNVNANRLNKTQQLNALLSQQQQLTDQLTKLQQIQTPQSTGNGQQPQAFSPDAAIQALQPFSDLIEDDFTDTFGPGSANRFIITDDKVISYSFKDTDEGLFTRVTVTGQGQFNPFTGANSVPILTASATDFDLWKQYGSRTATQTHNVPYFTSADFQCAPYAQMLLSQQRANLLSGEVTIIGNEYYQLGDVIYLTSKDLLYYVTSIAHQISYGGRFTTTLTLNYGHSVGEYIPSPLDVIGKNLIKNYASINSTFTNRQTASEDLGVLLGTVYFGDPNLNPVPSQMADMLGSDQGAHNFNQLKNALLVGGSQALHGKDSSGNVLYPKIEVRGYKIQDSDESFLDGCNSLVSQWLASPVGYDSKTQNTYNLNQKDFPPISADQFTGQSQTYDYTNSDGSGMLAPDLINRNVFPKEELYNLSINGTPNFGVEIVLVSS